MKKIQFHCYLSAFPVVESGLDLELRQKLYKSHPRMMLDTFCDAIRQGFGRELGLGDRQISRARKYLNDLEDRYFHETHFLTMTDDPIDRSVLDREYHKLMTRTMQKPYAVIGATVSTDPCDPCAPRRPLRKFLATEDEAFSHGEELLARDREAQPGKTLFIVKVIGVVEVPKPAATRRKPTAADDVC